MSLSVSAIEGLLATKFLAASGLCCTLWDHFLTLDDEIRTIWSRPWTTNKALFITNRYMVEGALLYAAYVFAGFRPDLDKHQCQIFTALMAILAFSTMGTANGFIAMRLYALWDRRKSTMIALWIAFVASYGCIAVFAVFTAQDVYKWTYYSTQVRACVVMKKPILIIGIWICMLTFDCFALSLALTNSFDRPHRHRVDVIINFKRDGAVFFVALLLLRLMNLVLTITLPAVDIFLASFFVWSMVCITLSRLILRVEGIKNTASASPAPATAVHLHEINTLRLRVL